MVDKYFKTPFYGLPRVKVFYKGKSTCEVYPGFRIWLLESVNKCFVTLRNGARAAVIDTWDSSKYYYEIFTEK